MSGFSISGELEDKSVLAVDQKASRERRGKGEVSVNPLQERLVSWKKNAVSHFFVDKVHYRSQPVGTDISDLVYETISMAKIGHVVLLGV